MKMKINDICKEFLSCRHKAVTYNVYGLNPIFTSDGNTYVKGSYIILDSESNKARYKKITSNKKCILLNQLVVKENA